MEQLAIFILGSFLSGVFLIVILLLLRQVFKFVKNYYKKSMMRIGYVIPFLLSAITGIIFLIFTLILSIFIKKYLLTELGVKTLKEAMIKIIKHFLIL